MPQIQRMKKTNKKRAKMMPNVKTRILRVEGEISKEDGSTFGEGVGSGIGPPPDEAGVVVGKKGAEVGFVTCEASYRHSQNMGQGRRISVSGSQRPPQGFKHGS